MYSQTEKSHLNQIKISTLLFYTNNTFTRHKSYVMLLLSLEYIINNANSTCCMSECLLVLIPSNFYNSEFF